MLSSTSPRCHLPNIAVLYPASESTSARVVSWGDMPAREPAADARDMPVLMGSLPVMIAALVGVH